MPLRQLGQNPFLLFWSGLLWSLKHGCSQVMGSRVSILHVNHPLFCLLLLLILLLFTVCFLSHIALISTHDFQLLCLQFPSLPCWGWGCEWCTVLVGALNWRMLFLNQDTPHFNPPCLRTPMPQLPPPWAVRDWTQQQEAQHHPGLVTEPWNTKQHLGPAHRKVLVAKGKAGVTLGAPETPSAMAAGSREGSRAGTGDPRADRDSHTTPGYSQTLWQRHTQPLQPSKG